MTAISAAFILLRSDPGGGMVERAPAVVAPAPTPPPVMVASAMPPEPSPPEPSSLAPSVVPEAPVAALSVTEPAVTRPALPEEPPLPAPSARLLPVAELTSDRGASPAYAVGDALTVVIRMREEGHVYCFYQMYDGSVLRLFPNRYQKESFLDSGSVMMVPSPDMKFRIVFDVAGAHESIRCFATSSCIATHLPSLLVTTDLAPLGMGLAEIGAGFRQCVRRSRS